MCELPKASVNPNPISGERMGGDSSGGDIDIRIVGEEYDIEIGRPARHPSDGEIPSSAWHEIQAASFIKEGVKTAS